MIDGYTEVHHILPKSLGGNDNNENLVRLGAREHFICHLLLTKMVKSNSDLWKMKNAVLIFRSETKDQQRYQGSLTSRVFEKIKKEVAEQLKRPVDLTEYTFYHNSGKIHQSTQYEFKQLYPKVHTNLLVNGHIKTSFGWRITEEIPENRRFDSTIREFHNVDGTVCFMTTSEFIKTSSLNTYRVSSLIRGKQKTYNGWSIGGDTKTKRQIRKFSYIRDDGKIEFSITPYALSKKYPELVSWKVIDLTKCKMNKYSGWSLLETQDKISSPVAITGSTILVASELNEQLHKGEI
jgi:hypothetical protein